MGCSVACLPAFDDRYKRKARFRLYTARSTNMSSLSTSPSPAFSICGFQSENRLGHAQQAVPEAPMPLTALTRHLAYEQRRRRPQTRPALLRQVTELLHKHADSTTVLKSCVRDPAPCMTTRVLP